MSVSGSQKGVHSHLMMIVVFLILAMALFAAYLLLGEHFVSYFKENVASEVKICESFEKVPLFGTVKCPG